jgi:hypothetical protein
MAFCFLGIDVASPAVLVANYFEGFSLPFVVLIRPIAKNLNQLGFSGFSSIEEFC